MTGSIGELAPGSGLTIFGAGDSTSPGILTMSVNNSYSGPTTVRGESFRSTVLAVDSIGNAGAGGVNSPLGASSNAAANLKLYDGGELRLTGTNANYSTDRGLTLGITNPPYLGGVINVQNAGTTLTWNGQITNESGAGLTKSGAGTLVLANAFNNFGPTTIEAGRLVLGNGNSLSGVVNVQGGGTFAPTIGPGTATVGSLHLDRGAAPSGGPTLAIELGGVTPGTEYDRLTITGQFSLGGTLAVSLLNGFAPADGQSFDIFNWGSLVGTFDSLDLPTLSTGLSWDASNLYTLGILAVHAGTGGNGDYDHNGIVNAGDYIVWRNSGGALGDYATWRANFGNAVGSGAGSTASAAIPEPAAFVLLLVAALARCCGRRRAPF
jgi:autotransporter-associated beta strand protein